MRDACSSPSLPGSNHDRAILSACRGLDAAQFIPLLAITSVP